VTTGILNLRAGTTGGHGRQALSLLFWALFYVLPDARLLCRTSGVFACAWWLNVSLVWHVHGERRLCLWRSLTASLTMRRGVWRVFQRSAPSGVGFRRGERWRLVGGWALFLAGVCCRLPGCCGHSISSARLVPHMAFVGLFILFSVNFFSLMKECGNITSFRLCLAALAGITGGKDVWPAACWKRLSLDVTSLRCYWYCAGRNAVWVLRIPGGRRQTCLSDGPSGPSPGTGPAYI